ncbi:MAG TPA: hypothetical protein PLH45_05350 [Synergistales bacterium]|nr:hypothetical protein [Synergistales bacterium]
MVHALALPSVTSPLSLIMVETPPSFIVVLHPGLGLCRCYHY